VARPIRAAGHHESKRVAGSVEYMMVFRSKMKFGIWINDIHHYIEIQRFFRQT